MARIFWAHTSGNRYPRPSIAITHLTDDQRTLDRMAGVFCPWQILYSVSSHPPELSTQSWGLPIGSS